MGVSQALIWIYKRVTISLEVILMASKNKSGYVVIPVDGKQVFEHRHIWENINGKIPNGFVLHHINCNRTDNRIENLELIESNGKHIRKYHSPFEEIERRELTDDEYNFIKDRLPLKQFGLLRNAEPCQNTNNHP